MEAVVFSFTAAGTALSLRIGPVLSELGFIVTHETMNKFIPMNPAVLRPFPLNVAESVRLAFRNAEALVFVGAAGIAVRSVAPQLRGKEKDPAVLVVDEKGEYVVPLLSGHIGGANNIARYLAKGLGGHAVITTATDVNNLFAVDEWAAVQGLRLSSLTDAKAFAAALLERGQAGLYSDFPLGGDVPASLVQAEQGPAGLAVTVKDECYPFAVTVVARPPILHIGVGCRRGASADFIARRVGEDMEQLHLSWDAVADVSTIDIKKDEVGITEFARARHLPVRYYTARQLNDAPGKFISSGFVRRVVGTDNVCERAAVLSSHGGRLLLEKSGRDGVTVAIACEEYVVQFGKKEDKV